jgi:S-adenosylmethionine-diacylgycerolhomoserine-N-methlytransferase
MTVSLAGDLRTLLHLTVMPIHGETHAQRLESFYAHQAADYDAFRDHLLRGREELYQSLPVPADGVWVEMGGGTGRNLAYLGPQIERLRQVYIVDLSPSLLAVARERIARRGWSNVDTVLGDVATFEPACGPADVITFSYSLTMIPDWYAALEQARRILRPGGILGAVDFYVSRKYPPAGQRRHGWLTRAFWPIWLAFDNVYPSPDHVPYLHRAFQPLHFVECASRMRYFPLLKVPYYRFVGKCRP